MSHGNVRSPYQPPQSYMRRQAGPSSPYPAPGHAGAMRADHLRKRPGHTGSPASGSGMHDRCVFGYWYWKFRYELCFLWIFHRSRQPALFKRRLLSDRILPDPVRKLVPDSQVRCTRRRFHLQLLVARSFWNVRGALPAEDFCLIVVGHA